MEKKDKKFIKNSSSQIPKVRVVHSQSKSKEKYNIKNLNSYDTNNNVDQPNQRQTYQSNITHNTNQIYNNNTSNTANLNNNHKNLNLNNVRDPISNRDNHAINRKTSYYNQTLETNLSKVKANTGDHQKPISISIIKSVSPNTQYQSTMGVFGSTNKMISLNSISQRQYRKTNNNSNMINTTYNYANNTNNKGVDSTFKKYIEGSVDTNDNGPNKISIIDNIKYDNENLSSVSVSHDNNTNENNKHFKNLNTNNNILKQITERNYDSQLSNNTTLTNINLNTKNTNTNNINSLKTPAVKTLVQKQPVGSAQKIIYKSLLDEEIKQQDGMKENKSNHENKNNYSNTYSPIRLEKHNSSNYLENDKHDNNRKSRTNKILNSMIMNNNSNNSFINDNNSKSRRDKSKDSFNITLKRKRTEKSVSVNEKKDLNENRITNISPVRSTDNNVNNIIYRKKTNLTINTNTNEVKEKSSNTNNIIIDHNDNISNNNNFDEIIHKEMNIITLGTNSENNDNSEIINNYNNNLFEPLPEDNINMKNDNNDINDYEDSEYLEIISDKQKPNRYTINNMVEGHEFFKFRYICMKLREIYTSGLKQILDNNLQLRSDDRQVIHFSRIFLIKIETAFFQFNMSKFNESYLTLKDSGIIYDEEEFAEILILFFGFDKAIIGEFLSKNKGMNKGLCMLLFFMHKLDFENMDFLYAFRFLWQTVIPPKDTNLVLEIIDIFTNVYEKDNPDYYSSDELYILCSTIMALNTSLHKNIATIKPLPLETFIKMNSTINRDDLVYIYNQLKEYKLDFKDDYQENFVKIAIEIKSMSNENNQNKETNKEFNRDTNNNNNNTTNNNLNKKETDSKRELTNNSNNNNNHISNNPQNNNIFTDHNYYESIIKLLKEGEEFTKYGNDGDPHTRFVFLSKDEKSICWKKNGISLFSKEGSIPVNELKQCYYGIQQSEIFIKNKVRKDLEPNCFSIVGIKRTLDLKHENVETTKLWFKAVKDLIAKYQADEKLKKKTLKSSSTLIINEIWKSMILPDWGRYRYYLLKEYKEKNNGKRKIGKKEIKNSDENKYNYNSNGNIVKLNSNNEKAFMNSLEEDKRNIIYLWSLGIPDFLRSKLWRILIGNSLNINEILFAKYLIDIQEGNKEDSMIQCQIYNKLNSNPKNRTLTVSSNFNNCSNENVAVRKNSGENNYRDKSNDKLSTKKCDLTGSFGKEQTRINEIINYNNNEHNENNEINDITVSNNNSDNNNNNNQSQTQNQRGSNIKQISFNSNQVKPKKSREELYKENAESEIIVKEESDNNNTNNNNNSNKDTNLPFTKAITDDFTLRNFGLMTIGNINDIRKRSQLVLENIKESTASPIFDQIMADLDKVLSDLHIDFRDLKNYIISVNTNNNIEKIFSCMNNNNRKFLHNNNEESIKQLEFKKEIIIVILSFLYSRKDIYYSSDITYLTVVIMLNSEDYFQGFSNLANFITNNYFIYFLKENGTYTKSRYNYFDKLFKKHLPQLHKQFQLFGYQTNLFFYEWVPCLFSKFFRYKSLTRLWDSFLLKKEVFVYEVALALLLFMEKDLRQATFEEIKNYLLSFNNKYYEDDFFDVLNKIDLHESFEKMKEEFELVEEKTEIFETFMNDEY